MLLTQTCGPRPYYNQKKIETVPNLIFSDANLSSLNFQILATARTQIAAREIVLWTTPSEPPKALQASECSELLDPMRASCLILAQHQPGKFKRMIWNGIFQAVALRPKALVMQNAALGGTLRDGRS